MIEVQTQPHSRLRRNLLSVALPTLLIVGVTIVGIVYRFTAERDRVTERLDAIAQARSLQVADWLRERQDDLAYLATSEFIATAYHQWHYRHDPESGLKLARRLDEFMVHKSYPQVVLVDDGKGVVTWNSDADSLDLDLLLGRLDPLEEGTGRSQRIGPYLDHEGRLRLDLVARLAGRDGKRGPLLVLPTDPDDTLMPRLQSWPLPSASGEILLFRRDGDAVLFLNPLHHRADSAARLRLPLADGSQISARVLLRQAETGTLIEALDYRDVPVLGTARPVMGTDWYVVAKLDRVECYAGARQDALFIGLAGLDRKSVV